MDSDLEDEGLSLRLDALKRVDGASKVGDHHYIPILHSHSDKVGRREKLLLAVLGLALARIQELRPASGLVARGPEARLGKVRLDAKLYRQAEQVLDEVMRLHAGGEPPRLTLNGHCQVCEFRQRCRKQTEQADDISLLGGVGEKELQEAQPQGHLHADAARCTFRPRKKGKRVKRTTRPHYAALQALAIREKKVHVYGIRTARQSDPGLPRHRGGNEDGLRLPARPHRCRGRSRRCNPPSGRIAGRGGPGFDASWTCWAATRTSPLSLRQLREDIAEADEEGRQRGRLSSIGP